MLNWPGSRTREKHGCPERCMSTVEQPLLNRLPPSSSSKPIDPLSPHPHDSIWFVSCSTLSVHTHAPSRVLTSQLKCASRTAYLNWFRPKLGVVKSRADRVSFLDWSMGEPSEYGSHNWASELLFVWQCWLMGLFRCSV